MNMTEAPKSAEAQKAPSAKATNDTKADFVMLDQLAGELKMSARDARMILRLAAKQKTKFPNLGKEHTPRQPWQWTPGSKALNEARKALSNSMS